MPSAEGSIILAERLTTVTNNRATERGEWSLDLCTAVTVKLPGLYVVLKEQEVLVLLPVLLLLLEDEEETADGKEASRANCHHLCEEEEQSLVYKKKHCHLLCSRYLSYLSTVMVVMAVVCLGVGETH